MKSRMLILSVVVSLSFAGVTSGEEGHDHSEHKEAMMGQDQSEGKSKIANIGNKICPVSGQSVKEMGGAHQVISNGKAYNLCCKMCVKSFKKEPKKYRKITRKSMRSKGHHH